MKYDYLLKKIRQVLWDIIYKLLPDTQTQQDPIFLLEEYYPLMNITFFFISLHNTNFHINLETNMSNYFRTHHKFSNKTLMLPKKFNKRISFYMYYIITINLHNIVK